MALAFGYSIFAIIVTIIAAICSHFGKKTTVLLFICTLFYALGAIGCYYNSTFNILAVVLSSIIIAVGWVMNAKVQ